MERKIFNFESIILEKETMDSEGYSPSTLTISSGKYVIAKCRYCGEPARMQKCQFTKTGSACHKLCRIEEQKRLSPFKNPETRRKAQENLSTRRTEIGLKIAATKSTDEYKKKIVQKNLEQIGVANVFQLDDVKKKSEISKIEKYGEHYQVLFSEKRKATNIEKYGKENPMQVDVFRDKAIKTNQELYGADNPMKNKEVVLRGEATREEKYGCKYPLQNAIIMDRKTKTNIEKYGFPQASQNSIVKHKIMDSFKLAVKYDKNNIFSLVNKLREDVVFWKDMETHSLMFLAKKYSIDYQTLTAALNRDEFKQKYLSTYTFPKKQMQHEIYSLIKTLTNKECLMDTRKIIEGYELDIFIPELKFAIEFNGNYYHFDKELYENISLEDTSMKYYHWSKTKKCEEKGIRLFHIFETDWLTRRFQILNYLKSALGICDNKIAARKCIISNTNSISFINQNHMQDNFSNALQFFNLEYNGEIVASMTASLHHRVPKDGQIILSRLCFKDNCTVQGGASKLFKAFVEWSKNNGYNQIVSWSDNCWTQGDIYPKLGFKLDSESPPDLFYWNSKTNEYHSRQSQKKMSLIDQKKQRF